DYFCDSWDNSGTHPVF
nr:immunoglobulin light chain junction region [Macaca mulatta]